MLIWGNIRRKLSQFHRREAPGPFWHRVCLGGGVGKVREGIMRHVVWSFARPLSPVMALLVVCAGGCAGRGPATTLATRTYTDAPAVALAFDPPVLLGQPTAYLPRDEREAAAFVGYDSVSATYFYIRNDDRLENPQDGWLYRRAIQERIGVSFR
jgi:hypothetical protein